METTIIIPPSLKVPVLRTLHSTNYIELKYYFSNDLELKYYFSNDLEYIQIPLELKCRFLYHFTGLELYLKRHKSIFKWSNLERKLQDRYSLCIAVKNRQKRGPEKWKWGRFSVRFLAHFLDPKKGHFHEFRRSNLGPGMAIFGSKKCSKTVRFWIGRDPWKPGFCHHL